MKPSTAAMSCSVVLTVAAVAVLQAIALVPLWPVFLAWACFFHLGGATEPGTAARILLCCAPFGVLMGWITALVLLADPLAAVVPSAVFGPLFIGGVIGAIALLARWRPLSAMPVCIYGYAATFGFLDVPGRFDTHVLTSMSVQNVVLALPAAIAIGCFFGYVNARLVGWLAVKPPIVADAA